MPFFCWLHHVCIRWWCVCVCVCVCFLEFEAQCCLLLTSHTRAVFAGCVCVCVCVCLQGVWVTAGQDQGNNVMWPRYRTNTFHVYEHCMWDAFMCPPHWLAPAHTHKMGYFVCASMCILFALWSGALMWPIRGLLTCYWEEKRSVLSSQICRACHSSFVLPFACRINSNCVANQLMCEARHSSELIILLMVCLPSS